MAAREQTPDLLAALVQPAGNVTVSAGGGLRDGRAARHLHHHHKGHEVEQQSAQDAVLLELQTLPLADAEAHITTNIEEYSIYQTYLYPTHFRYCTSRKHRLNQLSALASSANESTLIM